MLNASIVLYNHTFSETKELISVLQNFEKINEIFIIDNSPLENTDFQKVKVNYIFNNKNLGYGAAHNIAIRKTIDQQIPYHLVINPDIRLEGKVLSELLDFIDKNKEIGHVMPKVIYPNGEIQYLCKLLPKPTDLIFRRFLPKNWTKKSNDIFELRHSGYDKIMDVPYLSGCFMLLKTEVLKDVGLFDERFFMYPEDIDLTRRIHQKYRTVFYPKVQIVHNHEQASYKNLKLLLIHLVNLIKYFNKWGWFFDKERKQFNKDTLEKVNYL